MLPWTIYQMNQIRRQELFREAENARRARQARQNRPKANLAYAPLLAKLGRRLIRFGQSLEAEFAAPARLGHEL